MAVADHSSGNVFSGSGENVVQAGEIRGDVHLNAPERPRPPVPRQLPATTAHFVNRALELARLDGYLDAEADRPSSVVISAIAGTAGAGKTALAMHWGHRVRGRFPDGDLYVNLRGYDTGPPVSAEQALQRFLHALGVPSRAIPADVEAQAALYRSVLNERRVLVVLDNAASVEQVRPLLPAAPTCLALVTSRSRLAGLSIREGAQAMSLDLLSEEEGLALLRTAIGTRVDEEPGAAAELVRLCCHLPLALRIVAERAVNTPGGALADLVEDLTAEHDRLDVLSSADDDEASVRAVFSWSYIALPAEAARMFRLLSLHPGGDISAHAASALAGMSLPKTRRLLETLFSAHLLEQTARERYRFHDLLRAYATERAEDDQPEEDREAALDRLFCWYLHSADAAVREGVRAFSQFPLSLPPMGDAVHAMDFSSTIDALSWLDVESQNIADVVRFAAQAGKDSAAWKLPVICLPYFRLRRLWSILINTHNIGLSAAQSSGEDYGEAALLNDLGVFHRERGEVDDALTCFDRSLHLWERVDDDWGAAWHLAT
ncbi:ATP-binding protein [Allosalinactinospora lopnorensis]|uniref:ATP-binding protein n=1 Tax=Allosalinactinospora lopnorensis TaxID=1352348 RepID=UPI0006961D83|nr:NB-ARC domain-containing protein [Allosalinactinospora lopnorensis]